MGIRKQKVPAFTQKIALYRYMTKCIFLLEICYLLFLK